LSVPVVQVARPVRMTALRAVTVLRSALLLSVEASVRRAATLSMLVVVVGPAAVEMALSLRPGMVALVLPVRALLVDGVLVLVVLLVVVLLVLPLRKARVVKSSLGRLFTLTLTVA
jgi:hypothetical protein